MTEALLKDQLSVNSITRKNNHAFISADISGLFGLVFNDFGKDFTVYDINGEEPKTGIVAQISKVSTSHLQPDYI